MFVRGTLLRSCESERVRQGVGSGDPPQASEGSRGKQAGKGWRPFQELSISGHHHGTWFGGRQIPEMLVARVGWRLRSGNRGAKAAVGRDVEQHGVHLVSGKAVDALDPRAGEHPAALGNPRAAAPWVERGAAGCSRFRA